MTSLNEINGGGDEWRWNLGRVGTLELLRRFISDRILLRFSRKHRDDGLPFLAAAIGEHIGRCIAIQGLYERDLLEPFCRTVLPQLIPDAEACVALDVGANVGNHSAYLAQFFAEVIAFEPNPPVAAIFRANMMFNQLDDRVRLFEVGLSNADNLLPFDLSRSNLGGSRFLTNADDSAGLRLPVKRGDSLIAELMIRSRIGLIKLDVEGFELAAIEGLKESIERDHPVLLFESHDVAQARQIAGTLRSIGYEWFYAVETQRAGESSRVFGKLFALVTGDSIWIAPIRTFEPRYYPMIVASTNGLASSPGV